MNTELELIKKMESNDKVVREKFEELQERYKNEFVAIKNGKILDHDPNMKKLISRLEEKKEDLLLVMVQFIPEKGIQILY